MAIRLETKTNAIPPNASYPYGDISDNDGSSNGTPVNRAVYSDIHQFLARILGESTVVANDLPDNATNGFQYYEALQEIINTTIVDSRNIAEIRRAVTFNETAGAVWAFDESTLTTDRPGDLNQKGILLMTSDATVDDVGNLRCQVAIKEEGVYVRTVDSGSWSGIPWVKIVGSAASQAEVDAGLVGDKYVTPETLKNKSAPSWTNLTLSATASVLNGDTPQYRIFEDQERIEIRGSVTSGTGIFGEIIDVEGIPSDYRPPNGSIAFSVGHIDDFVDGLNIALRPDGSMSQLNGSGDPVSLHGISWSKLQ